MYLKHVLIKEWLIKKLGGFTKSEYETRLNRSNNFKKEQSQNDMSGESTTTTTVPGVPELAYWSELGIEGAVEYCYYKGNIYRSCTNSDGHKIVEQNKKKIRFRKQSKLNSGSSGGQRNTRGRQHDDNKKT